jgi:tRNA(fMet)-specific endonuclease VapC
VFIAAERRGHQVRDIFHNVKTNCGEVALAVSVVTIAELTHGVYRAKTADQQNRRMEFIDRLSKDIPVYPMSIEMARLAGRIKGEQAAKGIQIAFEDLIIAVTALTLRYDVATRNLRDFQRIPNLKIVQL